MTLWIALFQKEKYSDVADLIDSALLGGRVDREGSIFDQTHPALANASFTNINTACPKETVYLCASLR